MILLDKYISWHFDPYFVIILTDIWQVNWFSHQDIIMQEVVPAFLILICIWRNTKFSRNIFLYKNRFIILQTYKRNHVTKIYGVHKCRSSTYMAAHKVNRPFTLRNCEFSVRKQAPYCQKNELNLNFIENKIVKKVVTLTSKWLQ